MDGVSGLAKVRRQVGLVLSGLAAGLMAWVAAPGLPIWWAPRASAAAKAAGLTLFEHEWVPHDPLASGDGLGPVFNGRSCVACHFQGGVGGGGGNKQNVRSFLTMPTKDRALDSGLIHAFAVENKFLEGEKRLRSMFPVVPGSFQRVGGCVIRTRDFDPVRTESVNSTALFGAGWVDRLSGRTIFQQGMRKQIAQVGRELNGEFGGILPGRPRILPDGRVGKFGWKAQFASLEEFVAAACANEVGLGNPKMPQATPIGHTYPDVEPDLDRTQFRHLVAFIDTLSRPEVIPPTSSADQKRAERGREVFNSVGCAACHTPDIGGLDGVYSDFLLHRLDDRSRGGEGSAGGYDDTNSAEVPLPEAFPLPSEWKTPPLWGVADSAPYFHDGRSATLAEAISRHHGDAAVVRERHERLSGDDRQALLEFLKTLKAPTDARPAPADLARPVMASAH